MTGDALKRAAGDCPDLESVAAYLDGRLSVRDRALMTAHLADCDDCAMLLSESAQTRPTASLAHDRAAAGWRAWIRTPAVLWPSMGALAAAAVLMIAVGTGALDRWRGGDPPELRELVAAVGTDRTVEPRLTGGFAYGPVRGPVRGADPMEPAAAPDVRIAEAKLEKLALARRNPRTLRALGIAYLVGGDVERAIPVLEEAVDQPAPDAQALSDLSAAYLVRAARNNQPQDLAKALAAADRAAKIDPRLAEARFNRAQALERLSLADEARRAWQDYLGVDDRSGWADEARLHLRTLGAAPQSRAVEQEMQRIASAAQAGDTTAISDAVTRHPDAAREWVQDALLVEWPRALRGDDPRRAPQVLDAAARVADVIADSTGDRFMQDAVRAVARGSRPAAAAQALAAGLDSFRDGLADYAEDRIRASVWKFDAAQGPLDRVASPFAVWSRLFLAIGAYYAADLPGALQQLRPVVEAAGAQHYPRIEGLARRVRGLINVVQGDYAGGLDEYRLALTLLERARDTGNVASMHALIAEDYDFLGEPAAVWTELAQGLASLPAVSEFRHRHTVLQDASLAALRQGLPEAASYFQHATLENARLWKRPLALVNGHLYQGEISRELGDADAALAQFGLARQALSRVDDAQLVARDEPRILLAEGEVSRPADAIAKLTSALGSFETARRSWPIARVRLARARAYLREGRDDLAEADLSAGIELFEKQRASIADEALRSASFEQPWDLYGEMVRLQVVGRRRPDRGIAFAERSRARMLLESRGGIPVDPAAVLATLPPRVAVLYYATLDDRLLIWTLTRGRTTFSDRRVRSAELIHLLNQYRSEVAAQTLDAREMPSLAKFYDLLIRPVAAELPEGGTVVVIPDGVLHAVPFAALLRREAGRFLIEEYELQVAPSLTMFLDAAAPASLGAPTVRTIVFGNPLVEGPDAAANPGLIQAEQEAKEVAALYPGAELLLGAAATKQAFLDRAGEHAVVHFAGHAIANETRPDLSRLVMAGRDGVSQSLFAREIARGRFPATQLVVLGACRTTAGRIRRGEGVFGLARPFLAAGVPAVVATLWDVNDRATRRLLVAFHRVLRQGVGVTGALRRAQLELMWDPDPAFHSPAAWAGFTVIGGRADAGRQQTD